MYEPILMMVKNPKSYTFNRDAILVETTTGAKRALIDYRKKPAPTIQSEKKKVPGNVWSFPRVRYLMDEYENHPTQKPSALLKRIILASSNPSDTVLDLSRAVSPQALSQRRQVVSLSVLNSIMST